MMNQQDYDAFLKRVSTRVGKLSNYSNYQKFENDWFYYKQNIYDKYANKQKPPRIFIAESAPFGIYSLNTNYIFHVNTLNNIFCPSKDMYLWRYYRGLFSQTTINKVKKLTKLDALIQLAEKNILIFDLLPTHGIKLKSKERQKIKNFLIQSADFSPILKFKFPNQKINYAFSVPPSLHQKGMCTNILQNKFFQEFDNVNSGQGHAPSIIAIEEIIKAGF